MLLASTPRLVVRLTNTQVIAQLISFSPQGDKVIAAVNGKHLRDAGWTYSGKNIPATYLTGLLIGKMALKTGSKKGIFDTGVVTPLKGGRLFAFLRGVLDAGFSVPHGEEKIFPSSERLSGKHIVDFVQKVKGKAGPQFAKYLKSNASPDNMTTQFALVKKKIMG